MLTEKDYCDYETAWELCSLGYPEEDWILLYSAQKWLREKKGLHIEVRWYSNMWYEYEVKEAEGKVIAEGSAFPTYEASLSTAVYMATEHLKENGKDYQV